MSLCSTPTACTCATAPAMAAKIAGCVSFPPKPPPMRRTSHATAASGRSSTRATIFWTSLGCCVEERMRMPPPSCGSAIATWPSR